MGRSKNQKKADKGNNEKRTSSKPARRLGESDFVGQRLDFVTSKLPGFLEKRAATGGQKPRRGSGYSPWDDIMPPYWAKFGWRLPFTQEPPNDPEEAAAYARPPENDEEAAEMAKTVAETEKVALSFTCVHLTSVLTFRTDT